MLLVAVAVAVVVGTVFTIVICIIYFQGRFSAFNEAKYRNSSAGCFTEYNRLVGQNVFIAIRFSGAWP